MLRVIMESTDAVVRLQRLRTALYACLGRRADALFELGDAVLTAGLIPSPAHLSLEPSHRRGWGSLYAALARGQIRVDALRALLVASPLADEHAIYAVDVSVWPRCDAEASPERGY
jgi:DDE superfamily endonuclease